MKKLLLIPPDTRPPTLDLPADLATLAAFEVKTPPLEAQPSDINKAGSFAVLRDWLRQESQDAAVLICCLETLCLGGMIPARRVSDSLESASQKLSLLSDVKQLNPSLRILAFGVIVRVPHGNDPYEEKAYFADFGDALRNYSSHFDKWTRYGLKKDKTLADAAQATVPKAYFEDWLATRQRNHQLHLKALEMVKIGTLEHLCLTLDDTSTYGLAALDKRALEAKTDDLALWHKVDIYPGADEVPCTLIARVLQETASKVFVRYSAVGGAQAGMMFEDRPAGELIKAHLRAANCVQVDTFAEADWVLAVNVPAHKQPYETAQPDYAQVDTSSRHLPEFIDSIKRMLLKKPVAIADIAYPNGAELRFIKLLRQTVPLSHLAAFSAWNTAGNTLGSTIAMALCSQKQTKHSLKIKVLFNRLVDDYLYQADIRGFVYKDLKPDIWDLGQQQSQAEVLINQKLEPLAKQLWQEQFADLKLELVWRNAYLAWPRLFTGVFPFEIVSKE